MKKIILSGIAIVALYSILVYAYGFDCQGPLNQSTNYTLDSGVTPVDNGRYYVGCSLNNAAPVVRIIVTDLKTGLDVLNLVEYNISYSNNFFNATNDRSYYVYVSSGSTSGYALCEPSE